MLERIHELYQKLYEQNYQLLEENKKPIEQAETKIRKSRINYFLLRFSIPIIGYTLAFFLILFILSDLTPDYELGETSLFMTKTVMPFAIMLCFIFVIVINFRRMINPDPSVNNYAKNKEQYNEIFCENIFKPIIEDVIPNIQYDHSNGMSQELYESMGFPNPNDFYDTSDNIKLNSNTNLTMAKVNSTFKDTNGRRSWYVTLFCGIASIYTLTCYIPISITIRTKSTGILKLENEVQSYNEEFNKYYYLATDNPDLFNTYCTSKMLEYFTELAKKNINCDVKIFQNKICIRLHDQDFLDFNTKSEFDIENIINSCNSIMAIIDANQLIVEELNANNIY